MKRKRGLSLTELLVVISIMMLLMSVMMVGVSEVYGRAHQVQCQNNLTQLYRACVMFRTDKQAFPKSCGNPVAEGTDGPRWMHALKPYLDDDPAIFQCPVAGEQEVSFAMDSRESLPVLFMVTGLGPRCMSTWTHKHGVREWINGGTYKAESKYYPFTFTPPAFPAPAQSFETDRIKYSEAALSAYSQLWIVDNRGNGYGSKYDRALYDYEKEGIGAFVADRGGLLLFAKHVTWANDHSSTILTAAGAPIRQTGRRSDPGPSVTLADGAGEAGSILGGVTRLGSRNYYGYSPVNLSLGNGTTVVAKYSDGKPAVVVYDTGKGRVIVHSTCGPTEGNFGDGDGKYCPTTNFAYYEGWRNWFGDPNWSYDTYTYKGKTYNGGTFRGYDSKQYLINAHNWLKGSFHSVGGCAYGYNNQLGLSKATVAADTIVMMDYCDWEIDRDGEGSDHNDDYIPTRHGGRANVVFADGRVEALGIDDIRAGMWTPAAGD